MSYLIKIVCCACGKNMGTKKGGTEPNLVSHGYCDDCYESALLEIEKIKGGDTYGQN